MTARLRDATLVALFLAALALGWAAHRRERWLRRRAL